MALPLCQVHQRLKQKGIYFNITSALENKLFGEQDSEKREQERLTFSPPNAFYKFGVLNSISYNSTQILNEDREGGEAYSEPIQNLIYFPRSLNRRCLGGFWLRLCPFTHAAPPEQTGKETVIKKEVSSSSGFFWRSFPTKAFISKRLL